LRTRAMRSAAWNSSFCRAQTSSLPCTCLTGSRDARPANVSHATGSSSEIRKAGRPPVPAGGSLLQSRCGRRNTTVIVPTNLREVDPEVGGNSMAGVTSAAAPVSPSRKWSPLIDYPARCSHRALGEAGRERPGCQRP
jgi:hypothetical protein